MTPAETVVDAFGGPAALSEALGVYRQTVLRWLRPKTGPDTGMGGEIPKAMYKPIMLAAQERKLPVTVEMLIYGSAGYVQRTGRRKRVQDMFATMAHVVTRDAEQVE